MYGGIWTPLSLKKHAFFVLCMYRGHPNIWGVQMYRGHKETPMYVSNPNIWGASKHRGGIQTYGGVQTYGMSKHTRDIKIYAWGV